MIQKSDSPAFNRDKAPRLRLRAWPSRLPVLALFCLLALRPPAHADPGGAPTPESAASRRTLAVRLGERIYREGILPSGKPVEAVIGGDLAVNGRMFSCANCHTRSGLGSAEGGVATPPIAGSKLFQPSFFGRDFTPAQRSALSEHYRAPLRRPAYTGETLAAALRQGIDPAGRALNPVMPRYRLDDDEMAVLTAYLKSLSAEPSPGVTAETLRFATVVAPDVPPEESAAMLATLQAFADDWNARAPARQALAQYPEIAQESDLSYRKLSISRWQLQGPPASWRGQLEAYYGQEPVFALLGGIAKGEWKPIHDFSERHGIPCIFPITDHPETTPTDWYTLYFSKGLFQEGAAAAGGLGKASESSAGKNVVQLYRDNGEGRALAAGFEAAWRASGRTPPVNRVLPANGAIPQDLVRQLTGPERPTALLLWLGKEAVPIMESLAERERRPAAVYLSATLMQRDLWKLPEQAREFASIAYPYRLPQDEAMHAGYSKVWLRGRGLPVDDRRIASRMYTLMLLMNEVIPKMRRNFYRDHFLDLIDRSSLHGYPDYERLSFGPGQRYASKGWYLVTLSRGPNPILIKSDWIVP